MAFSILSAMAGAPTMRMTSRAFAPCSAAISGVSAYRIIASVRDSTSPDFTTKPFLGVSETSSEAPTLSPTIIAIPMAAPSTSAMPHASRRLGNTITSQSETAPATASGATTPSISTPSMPAKRSLRGPSPTIFKDASWCTDLTAENAAAKTSTALCAINAPTNAKRIPSWLFLACKASALIGGIAYALHSSFWRRTPNAANCFMARFPMQNIFSA